MAARRNSGFAYRKRLQRGFIHILLLVLATLGLTMWGASELQLWSKETQQEITVASDNTLSGAKLALLSYALVPPEVVERVGDSGAYNLYDSVGGEYYPFRYFALPCPDVIGGAGTGDRNLDGVADYPCDDGIVHTALTDFSRFGRLPWRSEVSGINGLVFTRGLGDIDFRDGHDQRLWYAAARNVADSRNKRNRPHNPHLFLRQKSGWMQAFEYDSSGNPRLLSERVAAFVFAPGPFGAGDIGSRIDESRIYSGGAAAATINDLEFYKSYLDAGSYGDFEIASDGSERIFIQYSNATVAIDVVEYLTAEELAGETGAGLNFLEDAPANIYDVLEGDGAALGLVELLRGHLARYGYLPEPAMFEDGIVSGGLFGRLGGPPAQGDADGKSTARLAAEEAGARVMFKVSDAGLVHLGAGTRLSVTFDSAQDILPPYGLALGRLDTRLNRMALGAGARSEMLAQNIYPEQLAPMMSGADVAAQKVTPASSFLIPRYLDHSSGVQVAGGQRVVAALAAPAFGYFIDAALIDLIAYTEDNNPNDIRRLPPHAARVYLAAGTRLTVDSDRVRFEFPAGYLLTEGATYDEATNEWVLRGGGKRPVAMFDAGSENGGYLVTLPAPRNDTPVLAGDMGVFPVITAGAASPPGIELRQLELNGYGGGGRIAVSEISLPLLLRTQGELVVVPYPPPGRPSREAHAAGVAPLMTPYFIEERTTFIAPAGARVLYMPGSDINIGDDFVFPENAILQLPAAAVLTVRARDNAVLPDGEQLRNSGDEFITVTLAHGAFIQIPDPADGGVFIDDDSGRLLGDARVLFNIETRGEADYDGGIEGGHVIHPHTGQRYVNYDEGNEINYKEFRRSASFQSDTYIRAGFLTRTRRVRVPMPIHAGAQEEDVMAQSRYEQRLTLRANSGSPGSLRGWDNINSRYDDLTYNGGGGAFEVAFVPDEQTAFYIPPGARLSVRLTDLPHPNTPNATLRMAINITLPVNTGVFDSASEPPMMELRLQNAPAAHPQMLVMQQPLNLTLVEFVESDYLSGGSTRQVTTMLEHRLALFPQSDMIMRVSGSEYIIPEGSIVDLLEGKVYYASARQRVPIAAPGMGLRSAGVSHLFFSNGAALHANYDNYHFDRNELDARRWEIEFDSGAREVKARFVSYSAYNRGGAVNSGNITIDPFLVLPPRSYIQIPAGRDIPLLSDRIGYNVGTMRVDYAMMPPGAVAVIPPGENAVAHDTSSGTITISRPRVQLQVVTVFVDTVIPITTELITYATVAISVEQTLTVYVTTAVTVTNYTMQVTVHSTIRSIATLDLITTSLFIDTQLTVIEDADGRVMDVLVPFTITITGTVMVEEVTTVTIGGVERRTTMSIIAREGQFTTEIRPVTTTATLYSTVSLTGPVTLSIADMTLFGATVTLFPTATVSVAGPGGRTVIALNPIPPPPLIPVLVTAGASATITLTPATPLATLAPPTLTLYTPTATVTRVTGTLTTPTLTFVMTADVVFTITLLTATVLGPATATVEVVHPLITLYPVMPTLRPTVVDTGDFYTVPDGTMVVVTTQIITRPETTATTMTIFENIVLPAPGVDGPRLVTIRGPAYVNLNDGMLGGVALQNVNFQNSDSMLFLTEDAYLFDTRTRPEVRAQSGRAVPAEAWLDLKGTAEMPLFESGVYADVLPAQLRQFLGDFPLMYAVAPECRRAVAAAGGANTADCAQGENQGLRFTLQSGEEYVLQEPYDIETAAVITSAYPNVPLRISGCRADGSSCYELLSVRALAIDGRSGEVQLSNGGGVDNNDILVIHADGANHQTELRAYVDNRAALDADLSPYTYVATDGAYTVFAGGVVGDQFESAAGGGMIERDARLDYGVGAKLLRLQRGEKVFGKNSGAMVDFSVYDGYVRLDGYQYAGDSAGAAAGVMTIELSADALVTDRYGDNYLELPPANSVAIAGDDAEVPLFVSSDTIRPPVIVRDGFSLPLDAGYLWQGYVPSRSVMEIAAKSGYSDSYQNQAQHQDYKTYGPAGVRARGEWPLRRVRVSPGSQRIRHDTFFPTFPDNRLHLRIQSTVTSLNGWGSGIENPHNMDHATHSFAQVELNRDYSIKKRDSSLVPDDVPYPFFGAGRHFMLTVTQMKYIDFYTEPPATNARQRDTACRGLFISGALGCVGLTQPFYRIAFNADEGERKDYFLLSYAQLQDGNAPELSRKRSSVRLKVQVYSPRTDTVQEGYVPWVPVVMAGTLNNQHREGYVRVNERANPIYDIPAQEGDGHNRAPRWSPLYVNRDDNQRYGGGDYLQYQWLGMRHSTAGRGPRERGEIRNISCDGQATRAKFNIPYVDITGTGTQYRVWPAVQQHIAAHPVVKGLRSDGVVTPVMPHSSSARIGAVARPTYRGVSAGIPADEKAATLSLYAQHDIDRTVSSGEVGGDIISYLNDDGSDLRDITPASDIEYSREISGGGQRVTMHGDMFFYLDTAYHPRDARVYSTVPRISLVFGDNFELYGPAALVPPFGGDNMRATREVYASRSHFFRQLLPSLPPLSGIYDDLRASCYPGGNCPMIYENTHWFPQTGGILVSEGGLGARFMDTDNFRGGADAMLVLPQISAQVRDAADNMRTVYAGSIMQPMQRRIYQAFPITPSGGENEYDLVAFDDIVGHVDVSPVHRELNYEVRGPRAQQIDGGNFNWAPTETDDYGCVVQPIGFGVGGPLFDFDPRAIGDKNNVSVNFTRPGDETERWSGDDIDEKVLHTRVFPRDSLICTAYPETSDLDNLATVRDHNVLGCDSIWHTRVDGSSRRNTFINTSSPMFSHFGVPFGREFLSAVNISLAQKYAEDPNEFGPGYYVGFHGLDEEPDTVEGVIARSGDPPSGGQARRMLQFFEATGAKFRKDIFLGPFFLYRHEEENGNRIPHDYPNIGRRLPDGTYFPLVDASREIFTDEVSGGINESNMTVRYRHMRTKTYEPIRYDGTFNRGHTMDDDGLAVITTYYGGKPLFNNSANPMFKRADRMRDGSVVESDDLLIANTDAPLGNPSSYRWQMGGDHYIPIGQTDITVRNGFPYDYYYGRMYVKQRTDGEEFDSLRLAHQIVMHARLTLRGHSGRAPGLSRPDNRTLDEPFFTFPPGARGYVLNNDLGSWISAHPYIARFQPGMRMEAMDSLNNTDAVHTLGEHNDGIRRIDMGGRHVLHRSYSNPSQYREPLSNAPVHTNVWLRLPRGGAISHAITGEGIKLNPGSYVNPIARTFYNAPYKVAEKHRLLENQYRARGRGEAPLRVIRPALTLPAGARAVAGSGGSVIKNVKAALFFSITPLESVFCPAGAPDLRFGQRPSNDRQINQIEEGIDRNDYPSGNSDRLFGEGHPCMWLDDRETLDGDRLYVYRGRRRYLSDVVQVRAQSNDRTYLLGGRLEAR